MENRCKKAVKAGIDHIVPALQAAVPVDKGHVRDSIKGGPFKQDAANGFYREVKPTGNDPITGESTSSKTKPFGAAVATGVNDGLTAKAVESTFSGGANAAATAMSNALGTAFGISGGGLFGGAESASKFETVGKAVAEGIAKGIKDNASKITEAAKAAAEAAYNAATTALEIKSPSRVMEKVGLFFDEGFAGGIRAGMDGVASSARALANMAAQETSGGGSVAGSGGSVRDNIIDYDRLGDAVADSFIRKGIDRTVIEMDKRIVGETVEPSVSEATYRRTGQSASGRSSRMVMV